MSGALDALVLDVVAWSAILKSGLARGFGAVQAEECIPSGRRRRLPEFTRNILRCAIPLLAQAPGKALVLCSINGDLASTVKLLRDLSAMEPLSPTLFALSVHNASAGALSLCVDEPGDQVAIAGGDHSLQAGLVEAYALMRSGAAEAVILVFAEDRLDSVYTDLDNQSPGVFLAMEVQLVSSPSASRVVVQPHRAGAETLVAALDAGVRQLQFAAAHMRER